MLFGERLLGARQVQGDGPSAMTWHAAGRDGRMYRCRCMRGFRVGDRIALGGQRPKRDLGPEPWSIRK